MIEINLLPPELKTVEEEKSGGTGVSPRAVLVGAAGALALILALHAVFFVTGLARKIVQARVCAEWKTLEPERQKMQVSDLEYAELEKQAAKIKGLSERRIVWGRKLKLIAFSLPPSVWLTELSFSSADFMLQGSVFSKEKKEMAFIREFIDKLKADEKFIMDFDGFEFSSAQKKTIASYEVTDFLIKAKLKKEAAR